MLYQYRFDKCSLIDGDVPHPIIWAKGNRAFLCRWYHFTDSIAHKQLMQVIGKKITDQYKDKPLDLFEVSGCMLRLVMWPTDLLWEFVDDVMNSYFTTTQDIRRQEISKTFPSRLLSMHFRCGDFYSKLSLLLICSFSYVVASL